LSVTGWKTELRALLDGTFDSSGRLELTRRLVAERSVSSGRPNETMERWEYRTLDITKRTGEAEALNRLGADGWEAVAMVSSWGIGWRFVHPIVLLKRRIEDAV
jgi:hypothetical protein